MAWPEWQRIDAKLERGEIDEAEWYARRQAVLVPAYLGGTDVYAQSGKSGGAASWEESRRLIVGVYNERADDAVVERDLASWGYELAGRREWPKPSDPRVARRLLWLAAH